MTNPSNHESSPAIITDTGNEVHPQMAIVVQEDPQQRDFADKIKRKEYVEAVALVVSQLCHLEIVTIVEDENDPPSNVDVAKYMGLPGQRIITRIDLVGGDITTILGKRFIESPEYQPLHALHNQQIKEGQDIVKANLENLMSAIDKLKNLTGQS